ncbi:glycerate kinase [Paenibacillus sp. NPDC058071]|uniref:glycerate kinase n=1 Tax=Paenibacillus sp. NPDC058071 TaxID=3346326 RepID=UPI0036DDCB0E
MRIVIAPDSFKGSLDAPQAGEAIAKGVRRAAPHSETIILPMADGGEGTMQCLIAATNGKLVPVRVSGPLGAPTESHYGLLGDGETAVVELAAASGLYLLDPEDRNPLRTTTFGFGQLIRQALDDGVRRFILALGGSATNDGGAGMLQVLGLQLLDDEGREIGYGGGELNKLAEIRSENLDARLAECEFAVACDVDHPFVGPNGASAVFGPQKGATPEMVTELDRALTRFADIIAATAGVSVHAIPGSGAAGGTAGGVLAFLKARLEPGAPLVARSIGLKEAIANADLVITGEGRIDAQTAGGKTPLGVAGIAATHGVPAIVLAGSVGEGISELHERGITAVFGILDQPMPLAEAMERTAELLEKTAEQAMRLFALAKSAP